LIDRVGIDERPIQSINHQMSHDVDDASLSHHAEAEAEIPRECDDDTDDEQAIVPLTLIGKRN
jgi:hypothetical protein